MSKILFYTSDGAPIRIGDVYWYVIGNKVYSIKVCSTQDIEKGNAQFYSEQLAKDYAK
jgi:hypothetical protein